jgi:predicted amidohydrolase
MKLAIATSYFPVSADIGRNLAHIVKQVRDAGRRGAHVIHFPEAGLSGYAGSDFESYAGFDWNCLVDATRQVMAAARSAAIWVLLGSTHRLSGSKKPHNSVYIIDPRGKIVDRYDKLFCAGPPSEASGDLAHYSPGDHFCVFTINGVRCGALICHDCRYPELYREYKRRGVQVMFHCYHAGNVSPQKWRMIGKRVGTKLHRLNRASTFPGIIFPATMQSMAANNFMWISCSNSSAPQSCFASFFVRADGIITGQLRRNTSGLLISTVDTRAPLYDSTAAWRDRAMKGVYHSGRLVRDTRSLDRTQV